MVAPYIGEDEELPEPEAEGKRPPWWKRFLAWAARRIADRNARNRG